MKGKNKNMQKLTKKILKGEKEREKQILEAKKFQSEKAQKIKKSLKKI